MGYMVPPGHFRPGIDLPIYFASVKTFTRTGPESDTDASAYDAESNEIHFGCSLAGNLFTLFNQEQTWGLLFKPYCQYYFSKNDFSELNQAINPNTAMDDDPYSQVGRLNNYGVMLLLVLGGK
jgi:hypothetical protein